MDNHHHLEVYPPHAWLKTIVDYYEEMTIDRRSLDEELTALKASIRCTSSKHQGEKLREVIPATSLDDFITFGPHLV